MATAAFAPSTVVVGGRTWSKSEGEESAGGSADRPLVALLGPWPVSGGCQQGRADIHPPPEAQGELEDHQLTRSRARSLVGLVGERGACVTGDTIRVKRSLCHRVKISSKDATLWASVRAEVLVE